MIKSFYGAKATGEVFNRVVEKSYSQALEEHSLTPLGKPKFDFNQKLKEGRGILFFY